MVWELLPFMVLTILAIGIALAARRLAGATRFERVVRWLRLVPMVCFLAALYFRR